MSPARSGSEAGLDLVYRQRVGSLLELIDAYDTEVETFRAMIAHRLAGHAGYRVIQQLDGIGPTFAAIFVAEIGDVGRFARPDKLCCWAGLTPRHRESDTTVHRGPITKQGSRLVRWAAIEAVQRTRTGTKLAADRSRIIARRGRNIGVVAAARKCSRWSTTGYATDRSARWPKGRREDPDAAGARGRSLS